MSVNNIENTRRRVMSLHAIRVRLQDCNVAAVARASGVYYGTVRAIATGENKNPKYIVVEKLSEYFWNRSEQ